MSRLKLTSRYGELNADDCCYLMRAIIVPEIRRFSGSISRETSSGPEQERSNLSGMRIER